MAFVPRSRRCAVLEFAGESLRVVIRLGLLNQIERDPSAARVSAGVAVRSSGAVGFGVWHDMGSDYSCGESEVVGQAADGLDGLVAVEAHLGDQRTGDVALGFDGHVLPRVGEAVEFAGAGAANHGGGRQDEEMLVRFVPSRRRFVRLHLNVRLSTRSLLAEIFTARG